jgi:hypothetical protein
MKKKSRGKYGGLRGELQGRERAFHKKKIRVGLFDRCASSTRVKDSVTVLPRIASHHVCSNSIDEQFDA